MTLRGMSWLVMLAALIAPATAAAQQDIHLDTRMFVERVQVDINGRSRRIVATAQDALPGDQLIVVVDWRHEGNRPIRGMAVVRPIPHGTQLDLSHPLMQLSVDGGVHWGRLDQLWLPTPLGGTRRATPADVTHVRWLLPDAVLPGQTGRLSYRATVR